MELQEAIALIRPAGWNLAAPVSWADLGCGAGLFSRALASLLPPGSTVYALDREKQPVPDTIPGRQILFRQADLLQMPLPIPQVSGMLLANVLHYVSGKQALLRALEAYFLAQRTLLIIEYDTLAANPWVPYPVDFAGLQSLLDAMGYKVRTLGRRASVYGRGDMYAVLATNPG